MRISRLHRWFAQNPIVVAYIIFAAVFFANGLHFTDIDDFMRIARSPFQVATEGERQMFYASPLNYLIAAATGLDNLTGFFLIHGLEVALLPLCVGWAARRKIHDPEQCLRFLILLSLAPLWLVMLKWVGKVDPVVVGCFALCWATRSRWRLIPALIMVVAHREIGSLLLLSLYFLEDEKDVNLAAPLVAGNLFHLIYQYGVLDFPPQTRLHVMASKLPDFLRAFSTVPALYIMTMFNWYWVVLLMKKPTFKETSVIAVAALLALSNEDFTRDFIMAALPALFFHAERVARDETTRGFARLAPLAMFQFQIAAMGQVFHPENGLVFGLMGLS